MKKLILCILLVLSLLLTGCECNSSETEVPTSVVMSNDTQDTQNIITESIKFYNGKLDADTVIAKTGDKIILEIINLDNQNDTVFIIEGYDISQKIAPGKIQMIEFEATNAGSFNFGFRRNAIKGNLVVN